MPTTRATQRVPAFLHKEQCTELETHSYHCAHVVEEENDGYRRNLATEGHMESKKTLFLNLSSLTLEPELISSEIVF